MVVMAISVTSKWDNEFVSVATFIRRHNLGEAKSPEVTLVQADDSSQQGSNDTHFVHIIGCRVSNEHV